MKEFKLDDQIWSDYLSVTETVNGNSLTRGVDYFYPGISEKICHEDRYKNYFKNKEKEVEGYGLLYRYRAAWSIVPKGWRLPTCDDFYRLQTIIAYHNYKRKDLEEIWGLKFPGVYDIRFIDYDLGNACFLMGSQFNVNPEYLMGCYIDEFGRVNDRWLHDFRNDAISVRLIKI